MVQLVQLSSEAAEWHSIVRFIAKSVRIVHQQRGAYAWHVQAATAPSRPLRRIDERLHSPFTTANLGKQSLFVEKYRAARWPVDRMREGHRVTIRTNKNVKFASFVRVELRNCIIDRLLFALTGPAHPDLSWHMLCRLARELLDAPIHVIAVLQYMKCQQNLYA